MSDSSARRLLLAAGAERGRLRRHLLVAAALREALPEEPVVVGGTAEEFWTADDYHETDLDLCVPLDRSAQATLRRLGFRREGRHWIHEAVNVAVEFPDASIDGDVGRSHLERIEGGAARIIGVDDLYLDRLRQATFDEQADDVHFHSALAVAAACFDVMDRPYVEGRIGEIERHEPMIGRAMRRVESRIHRRLRRTLGDGE